MNIFIPEFIICKQPTSVRAFFSGEKKGLEVVMVKVRKLIKGWPLSMSYASTIIPAAILLGEAMS